MLLAGAATMVQGYADGQNAERLHRAALQLRERCADYIVEHRCVLYSAGLASLYHGMLSTTVWS